MTMYSGVDTNVEEHQRLMLSTQYPGWRVGLGGSGRWWAVRGADHVWGASPEELEAELRRHEP